MVVFDPLDGSSNIDAGISTGSIFGIYAPSEECSVGDMDNPEAMMQNCIINVCQVIMISAHPFHGRLPQFTSASQSGCPRVFRNGHGVPSNPWWPHSRIRHCSSPAIHTRSCSLLLSRCGFLVQQVATCAHQTKQTSADACHNSNHDTTVLISVLGLLMQPGSSLLAAGYCLYSSSTVFVLTIGSGVYGFTYDSIVGEFVLSHPNMKVGPRLPQLDSCAGHTTLCEATAAGLYAFCNVMRLPRSTDGPKQVLAEM